MSLALQKSISNVENERREHLTPDSKAAGRATANAARKARVEAGLPWIGGWISTK